MTGFIVLILLCTVWIRFFSRQFPFWDRVNHFLVGLAAGILSFTILYFIYLKIFPI